MRKIILKKRKIQCPTSDMAFCVVNCMFLFRYIAQRSTNLCIFNACNLRVKWVIQQLIKFFIQRRSYLMELQQYSMTRVLTFHDDLKQHQLSLPLPWHFH